MTHQASLVHLQIQRMAIEQSITGSRGLLDRGDLPEHIRVDLRADLNRLMRKKERVDKQLTSRAS